MAAELSSPPLAASAAEQDGHIAAVVRRESQRLRNFVRRRVADAFEADDIVQDVFSELVEATRIATPIEHVGGWLFRVATNRITDAFRRRRTAALDENRAHPDDDDRGGGGDPFDDLPWHEAGPEARYADRAALLAFEAALAELPAPQREVFIAHELEGRSFKALSAESGVGVSTLLARKRYAVLHLRQRLKDFTDIPDNDNQEPA